MIMERNHLDFLQDLGLSPNESRLYLALLDGPKTGQTLSKVTGIARTRVYVDLETLHSQGFIERRDGKVRLFIARSPDAVLDGILSDREVALRKTKEKSSLFREELRSLYRAIEENDADLPQTSHERITNLDVYVQKVLELFEGTKSQISHLACYPSIPRAFSDSVFQQAATRGIQVRYIKTLAEIENEVVRQNMQDGTQNSITYRFLPVTPCRVTIYDDRVAVVCSPGNCQLDARRVDVYMARQQEFVSLHKAAFEYYWNQALTFEQALNELKNKQYQNKSEDGQKLSGPKSRSAAAS